MKGITSWLKQEAPQHTLHMLTDNELYLDSAGTLNPCDTTQEASLHNTE